MKNRPLPDPRVLFALALLFSVYGVVIKRILPMTSLLFMATASAAALGVSLTRVAKRLRRLLQFVFITALLQSVFAPSGRVLFAVYAHPILTLGGLEKGATVLLRLSTFILVGAMFTRYDASQLVRAMIKLRLPQELAYMILIGIRFMPKFAEEFKDALTALQLRGIVIDELKLKRRVELYGYLLFPVLVKALSSADELAKSMDMRAFRAYDSRTAYVDLTLNAHDKRLLFLIALLFPLVYAMKICLEGLL